MMHYKDVFDDYLKLLAECPSWKGYLGPGPAEVGLRDSCTCFIKGGFFHSIISVIDSLTQYCSWPQLRPSACIQRQETGPAKGLQASYQEGSRHEGSAVLVHRTPRAGRREGSPAQLESRTAELRPGSRPPLLGARAEK